jgi:hypothetical protein
MTNQKGPQAQFANRPTGQKQVSVTVHLDEKRCTVKIPPRTSHDDFCRKIEGVMQLNLDGPYADRVVTGLGRAHCYQEGDVIVI